MSIISGGEKHMKRAIILTLLAAAVLLAACGPSATTAPSTTAPTTAAPSGATSAATSAPAAGGAVKGNITIWNGYHTGDNEEKTLNQLLDAAKKQYPDAKITVL